MTYTQDDPRSQLATKGSSPMAACSAACNDPGIRGASMTLARKASTVTAYTTAVVANVCAGMSRSTKSITSPLSRRRR